jgi:hypothetical protein
MLPAEILSSWPDAMGIAVGAALVLPAAAAALAWQRWQMLRLERRAAEKDEQARRLAESLASAPDGFYAWMGEGRQMCSRRLAVLLGLGRGVESAFEDVLAAFTLADSGRLETAIDLLRVEGAGFEMELGLAEGGRRIRA